MRSSPPVGNPFNLMAAPLLRLEKIHRQAENNPIIKLSAHIRECGELRRDLADNEHIGFVSSDKEAMEMLFNPAKPVEELYDQAVLCYRNATRVALNKRARQLRHGKFGLPPQANDQVICLRNSKESGLFNGMRGHISAVKEDNKQRWDMRIELPEDDRSEQL